MWFDDDSDLRGCFVFFPSRGIFYWFRGRVRTQFLCLLPHRQKRASERDLEVLAT